MTPNLSRLTRKITRVRNLFVAILVFGSAFGRITHAEAQKITPPTTPGALAPPAGNSAFLLGHAVGTQGYVCLPTSAGASTASWTVNASCPEATLYVKFFNRFEEVVTHFLSPDALRQRNVAEFLRQHQGVGANAANDSRRLRPELPECWRDCLPLIAVDRVGCGSSRR